ncbi:MAG: hypothetical protein M0R46_15990 [Candidatus Muirbacterium halophilum]|nr:hypothetical protein [Candidatus Muirbacterium halophilum]MCK9477417.1 hypothetical protein [Candidatus Muirbacterium halophilum]
MRKILMYLFIFLIFGNGIMASENVNVGDNQEKITKSFKTIKNIYSQKTYLELHYNVFLEVMSEINVLIHDLITNSDVSKSNKIYSVIQKKINMVRYIIDRGNTALIGKSIHQIDPSKETLYKCKRCNGKDADCKFCSGDGWSWTPENVVDCTLCDGKGTVGNKDCPACRGFGSPDSLPNNPNIN